MYPSERAILLTVLTGMAILAVLCLYFSVMLALYQRRKRKQGLESLSSAVMLFEREQSRIALDLHDDIGNDLSAIRLQLELQQHPMTDQLGSVIHKLRQLTFNTMPSTLERSGLHAALQQLTATASFHVHISCNAAGVALEKQLHIFRILQELYANSVKHGKPSNLSINMYSAKGKLVVRYREDGKGFDRDMILASTKGAGLHNIQSRGMLLNGAVYFITRPGNGITCQVEVPL